MANVLYDLIIPHEINLNNIIQHAKVWVHSQKIFISS